MKALTYNRYGPPEVVEVTEQPTPEIGPEDILVRVRASAVNTGDWRIRAAAFPGVLIIPGRLMYGLFRPRNPRLGSEFAGDVEAIGGSVKAFQPGDRVFGMLTSGGASAEYLAMSETAAIAHIPPHLDYVEAAALPFGGLCALSFLRDFANLVKGQRLLVVGASGGVGCYAVQVGKALGAHVTGVASTASQEFIASLGADAAIDYKKTPVETWPTGFDVILDTVGVLIPRQSRSLLRSGGLFMPLNFGLREVGAALLNPLRSRRIRIAVNEDTQEGLKDLATMITDGQVRPVIDSQFPLSSAVAAHHKVESRHRQGAVILTID